MRDFGCQAGLDVSRVHDLFEAQGYQLLCRHGHIHALIGVQEYHVCLVAELAGMNPARLLARFEEAIRLRLQSEQAN